jgi:hypothetical protein
MPSFMKVVSLLLFRNNFDLVRFNGPTEKFCPDNRTDSKRNSTTQPFSELPVGLGIRH